MVEKGMEKGMEKGSFVAVVDGKEITFEVLATFDNDETHKSYIIYTDNSTDEDGNVNVFASVYERDGESVSLQEIETESEWKDVEAVLSNIQEQLDQYSAEKK